MNKKIAIVVCAWPPQGGGIGNNAYYHAQKIAERGYDVEVFTPWYATTKEREEKFKITYLNMWPRFGMAGFSWSLYGQLRSFDVVHLYYPFFGNDLIILLFKKLHPQIKFIIHYEMDPIGRGWQKYFFSLYMKLFLGCMVRSANKIIALSWDHAENSYLSPYVKKWKEKFISIPNGIDTTLFRPASKNKDLMDFCLVKEGDKVVIFVGGLDKQHYFKGVDVLLQAFKMAYDHDCNALLLIIGEGDLKEKYRAQAQALGIEKRVIFAGWVDNGSLPKYYSMANVFVLPSTASTESFGIVTAEAQACGVPAVVSNWPGSRQTLENNETGFIVEPGNVKQLAEKMCYLLHDADGARAMGEKASIRAQQLYDWEKVIGEIDLLYRSL